MGSCRRGIPASVLALSAASFFAPQLIPAGASAVVASSTPVVSPHSASMRNAVALDPGPAPGTTYSTNWSGYAATGGVFTDVSGSWVQPALGCGKAKLGFAAFWVGLDGFTSQTVEQTGTEAVCVGKQTTYDAFYELYPAASVVLDSSTYPVLAGDTLTADVAAGSGSVFTISLTSTRGWSFSTTGSAPTAAQSSAEWIAEAPSLCALTQCFVLPLAKFGTIGFTGASATSGGTAGSISAYANERIVMAKKNKVVKANPSALAPDGTGFSDKWAHS